MYITVTACVMRIIQSLCLMKKKKKKKVNGNGNVRSVSGYCIMFIKRLDEGLS